MTEYCPDLWVVVKIDSTDPTKYPSHKVFGTWRGGYLDGDSWRMNSGIDRVSQDGNYLLFHGFSGSVYRCHKDGYGTSPWSFSVLNGMIEGANTHPDVSLTILEDDTTNWWLTLGAQ